MGIKGLDKYLTTEPPDNSDWFIRTYECMVCTPEEYDVNEKLIEPYTEILFRDSYSPNDAAKILDLIIKLKPTE